MNTQAMIVIENETGQMMFDNSGKIMQFSELLSAEPERVVKTHIQDGYVIDSETGEAIGVVEPYARFEVTTDSSADWVLEKFMDCDTLEGALTARKEALVKNMDSQIAAVQQRKAYLKRRFEGDLRAFLHEKMKSMKAKFWQGDFGRLSVRKTPGSIEVLDRVGALEWAKANVPSAVKATESVLISELKGKEDDLPCAVFAVHEPGESFKVESGVK